MKLTHTYEEHEIFGGGTQRLFKLPNGYGASAICTSTSYGGLKGLWELAVLHGDEQKLCYRTMITDDVIGHLSWPEVEAFVEQIAKLPPCEDCPHKRN